MTDCPKLRPVEATPVPGRGLVQLRDPLGVAPEPIFVPAAVFSLVALFDGQHTLRDIQVAHARRTGELLMTDKLEKLAEQLDERLFLEGERSRQALAAATEAYRALPHHASLHAGRSYPDDPQALGELLDGLLHQAPSENDPPGPLRGLIAPHLDFDRGGAGYAAAYRVAQTACAAEVRLRACGACVEDAKPEVFVILGTAHVGEGSYILTDKSFETPLGLAPADAVSLARLRARWGEQGDHADRAAEWELIHKTEHSIEFQVIWLQHVFADRDFAIIPVLCGGFGAHLAAGRSPQADAAVATFSAALAELIADLGDRVCVIASADLAHVGPQFGGREPMAAGSLALVRARDGELLEACARGDPEAFFGQIVAEGDARNICGLPPIYTLLAALRPEEGRLLHYGQAPVPGSPSAVTYAAMALY
jgi:AmmeMemoRadiSam system protein B